MKSAETALHDRYILPKEFTYYLEQEIGQRRTIVGVRDIPLLISLLEAERCGGKKI